MPIIIIIISITITTTIIINVCVHRGAYVDIRGITFRKQLAPSTVDSSDQT